MEFEGRELAFGVNEVIGFNPLERGVLKPVPVEMGKLRELSMGVFLYEGEPVLVLDAGKLMMALSRAFGVVRVVA